MCHTGLSISVSHVCVYECVKFAYRYQYCQTCLSMSVLNLPIGISIVRPAYLYLCIFHCALDVPIYQCA